MHHLRITGGRCPRRLHLAAASLLTTVLWLTGTGRVAGAEVVLARDGRALAAIYVAETVMAPDREVSPAAPVRDPEYLRRRLRASVADLADYLGRISGAKFDIHTGAPPADAALLPILVGDLAAAAYGEPRVKTRLQQGWRLHVGADGVGVCGESDEAASYAVYDLLERLGCRWYMPSEMGEVVPQHSTLVLPELDASVAPRTEGRVIWYADDDFRRRTRHGGDPFNGGHALELNQNYVSNAQLAEHPEWVGRKDGRILPNRFCWANQGLRDAVAQGVIAKLDQNPTPSLSIGPDDGVDFCECADCRALDAGDLDVSMNCVSITDRFVNFANAVAAQVAVKQPDTILAFLSYVQYTRPPVREKLRPNLAPVIAPITYCRAHAITDAKCPSRSSLKAIVEGWGKAAKNLSYYNYMFHLAEVSVPYPMIAQMSEELPILYASGVNVWSPETMPVFDSNLPGMVLAMRMAIDAEAEPETILDEFFSGFYGAAAVPMRQYWQGLDEAWTQVAEHAGCCFGYGRRFSPEVLAAARAAIDAALAACRTDQERARVQLCNDSLSQFELFMKLRRDLFAGRLQNLARDAETWMSRQSALGAQYAPQYAFSSVGWTPRNEDGTSVTIAGQYFRIFVKPAYEDGARIARDFTVIGKPLRNWRYRQDGASVGADQGWYKVDCDDHDWPRTDPCIDTWYALGLAAYYGPVWYRDSVTLAAAGPGKRVFLWVSSTDGKCRVYVNGQPCSAVAADGGVGPDEVEGYCQPFSFDITAAIKPEQANQITIVGTRTFLNELGTGGLLGPVLVYAEK